MLPSDSVVTSVSSFFQTTVSTLADKPLMSQDTVNFVPGILLTTSLLFGEIFISALPEILTALFEILIIDDTLVHFPNAWVERVIRAAMSPEFYHKIPDNRGY